MQYALNLVQGLPLPGKIVAAAVIVAVAGLLLYLVFQSPRETKPQTTPLPSSAVTEAGNVPPAQEGQHRDAPAAPAGHSNAEAGAKPASSSHITESEASNAQAKDGSSVQVGNVSSQDQTGGITAGYIGNVNRK